MGEFFKAFFHFFLVIQDIDKLDRKVDNDFYEQKIRNGDLSRAKS